MLSKRVSQLLLVAIDHVLQFVPVRVDVVFEDFHLHLLLSSFDRLVDAGDFSIPGVELYEAFVLSHLVVRRPSRVTHAVKFHVFSR